MRKLFAAVLCCLALLLPTTRPAHAQFTAPTRAQILSWFGGTSGIASSTNCFPTNGVGTITGASIRACMIELVNSISLMFGEGYVSVLNYSADPTNTNDNTSAFSNAFAQNCGGTIFVPKGHYKFTGIITDPHCGLTVLSDPNAIWDFSGEVSNGPYVVFSGALTGVAVSLTGNFTPYESILTVSSANSTQFCQPNNSIISPACALYVTSTITWAPSNDPSLAPQPIGQILPIMFVNNTSGNISTSEPAEDSYNTGDSATAQPLTLIGGLVIDGGQFLGAATDNRQEAMQVIYGYFPTVRNVTFKNFGENALQINSSFGEQIYNNSVYGLGSTLNSGGDDYGLMTIDGTINGDVHDNYCYNTGACLVIANNPSVGGSTRHISFHNNKCLSIQSIGHSCLTTHFEGEDIKVSDNLFFWSGTIGNEGAGVNSGIPDMLITGNKITAIWGSGVLWENGTNRDGNGTLVGNQFYQAGTPNGAGEDCVNFEPGQGTPTLSVGAWTNLTITGNTMNNCGRNGIFYNNNNASNHTIGTLTISGNTINTPNVDTGAGCIIVTGGLRNFAIVGNTCMNVQDGLDGIQLTDAKNGTVANNTIAFVSPGGGTGIGLHFICASSGSGTSIYTGGNVVQSLGSPNGTGQKNDNNCTNMLIGPNYFRGASTTFTLGSGTGNESLTGWTY